MIPISRHELQSLRNEHIAKMKSQTVQSIVSQIQTFVRQKALKGEMKYVQVLDYIVGTTGLIDPTKPHEKPTITITDIREELLDELRRFLIDCKIEYIERHPTDDIFGPSGRRQKPNSDGIDRAILIDWT
jgi:hypothetical protein